MNKENFERAKEIEKSISNFNASIKQLNEMQDCLKKNNYHFNGNVMLSFYFSSTDYRGIFDIELVRSMIYSSIKKFEIGIENLEKEFQSL